MVSKSLIHALCIPCYCRSECIYCIFLSLVCPLSLAHLWNNVDKLQFLVSDSSRDCFLLHQVYASAKKIDHTSLVQVRVFGHRTHSWDDDGEKPQVGCATASEIGATHPALHPAVLWAGKAGFSALLAAQVLSFFFHIKIRGWLPDLDVAC